MNFSDGGWAAVGWLSSLHRRPGKMSVDVPNIFVTVAAIPAGYVAQLADLLPGKGDLLPRRSVRSITRGRNNRQVRVFVGCIFP